ncbi:DUF6115 domain-containing protein [Paenibacillus gansuensis]|uniref:DUF6115 domain-containing protein n=1 Tax=Paenibacillus gansuensis TaxID=306542 RepID=A0ABW5PGE0_9BACL
MSSWSYIVLLGSVVAVLASLMPKRADRQQGGGSVKDFQESLEHYMGQIEQENRELLAHFSQIHKEHDREQAELKARINQLEEQYAAAEAKFNAVLDTFHKQLERIQARSDAEWTGKSEVKSSENEPVQDTGNADQSHQAMQIKQRYSEVFELQSQGKSADYIAKKLSMNKGELQLILQLARQEETLRA